MPCVETPRLSADIETVAMERVPGSTHWQTVQDLCKTRLEEAGYEVELDTYDTGVNVIGRRPGLRPDAGLVIVSAHYDHIGGCPGASDNAAGIASALEVARVLAHRENQHPLVIACWDEEETGLVGSRAYAAKTNAANTPVSAMFSFDAIGYISNEPDSQALPAGFGAVFPDQEAELVANQNRGDFVALVSDEGSATITSSFIAHADSINLKTIAMELPESLKLSTVTSDLRRSDHAAFWELDYPGIQLTDTADFRNPNYHCRDGIDLPSTLDVDFLGKVVQATIGASIDVLDAP